MHPAIYKQTNSTSSGWQLAHLLSMGTVIGQGHCMGVCVISPAHIPYALVQAQSSTW